MLIGYMRVSSTDDRQSVDLQRDALIAAGVDSRHLFSDKASGAREDRVNLRACLEYLKTGDTLVVWKLDRLGRSLPHLLSILTDLRERGVSFRSLTEQMDTGTPHGELLFSLFGALAQYERALTRERIMAGLAAARRRGRRGGRPPKIDAEKLEQITAALAGGREQIVDQPHIQCAAIDPCGHLSSNRVGSAKGGRVMSRAHVDLFRVHENYCATDLMGVRN